MHYLLTLLLVLLQLTTSAQTQSRLLPKKGLYVTTSGITWASGSEFNVFTADRKHHHYYFTWWEQDADSTIKGKDVLYIGSTNTAVHGTYSLQQTATQTQVAITGQWNRTDSGLADVVHARLWLPYFHEARWLVQNKPIPLTELEQFYGTALEVQTPFGYFKLEASHPFRILRNDAPNPGANDYEKRSQYLLLYEQNIPLHPNGTITRNFTITEVAASPNPTINDSLLVATGVPVQQAWLPDLPVQELLPRPQRMVPGNGYYIIPPHAAQPMQAVTQQFHDMLRLHWQIGNQYYPNITAQINNRLPEEGYTIDVDTNRISISYKTPQGLQHALYTLVQLVQNQNGKLVVPACHITDAPAIGWRGIHMFTGPTSWPLHRRMYERVLLPLKMNHVVLQCEQAAWKSFPNIHNNISVPLADLKAEFAYLRSKQVQPIPLIQSLGHMEWFFKPVENRKWAVNPLYPYTLNAALPEARKAVKKLWDEAFRLLQPNIMHIGFDEIGMIGFHLPRETEVDLWKTQINFLHRYAQRKKATLMLWGDMALAPGEGPDATLAPTKERAALLRSTIPRGSYIGDWHYINNPNPDIYKPNLRIWKENGNIPIAAPWLRPNNVRGFVLAAKEEGAGVLQTTWADFESSEANMLSNIEQFGAYILALDYAWSGRTELPEKLPYKHIEEWNQRFYSQPKPVHAKNGWQVSIPVAFRDYTTTQNAKAPATVVIPFDAKTISGIQLQAATQQILPEGMPVVQIEGTRNGLTVFKTILRYGAELRGKHDTRPVFTRIPGKDAKTFYHFFEQPIEIDTIHIRLLHNGSGLEVANMILIE
ncbi:MAG: glycoside hydrolase family 20 zincin-like fold domain-containing protein [Lacibacter sp.]